jgi:hypothetical protein
MPATLPRIWACPQDHEFALGDWQEGVGTPIRSGEFYLERGAIVGHHYCTDLSRALWLLRLCSGCFHCRHVIASVSEVQHPFKPPPLSHIFGIA